ncbi:MAG: ABC transporter, partial [Azospirillum brasilense]
MSNVLNLAGITRHYTQGEGRALEVLTQANLRIDAGELVALIGPSGSGKSTLLQVAGLLDTPQAGTITIGGEDASTASDAVRTALRNRYIGFIYQFHHLLPELTALEN